MEDIGYIYIMEDGASYYKDMATLRRKQYQKKKGKKDCRLRT